MRAFLLACVGVAVIGMGAYALFEGVLARNAGTEFAVKGSTRVSEANKVDPRGYLSSVHEPAGAVSSGRDGERSVGGPASDRGRPAEATEGKR